MNSLLRKKNLNPLWVACLLPLGMGHAANTLTPEELSQGFELMFDGKNLSNSMWVNYQQGNETNTDLSTDWKVLPADSAFGKTGQPRDIRSRNKYSDFEVRFEFRTGKNAGLYYRELVGPASSTGYRSGWYSGVEYAMEDDITLTPWLQTGAAYEIMSAEPNNKYNNYSSGKWNVGKLIVNKDSVEHWLNGSKVVGFKYWDANWAAAMDGRGRGSNGARSKWNGFSEFSRPTMGAKTGYITSGYLGLQGDHPGDLKIRNIRIANLPLKADSTTNVQGKLADQDRNVFSGQIGFFQGANGEASLNVPFSQPYELSIINSAGSAMLQPMRDSKPRVIALNRASFQPGIYFMRMKIKGISFTKALTLQ